MPWGEPSKGERMFIQELAAELAAAEANGMKPDLSKYKEPEKGEEVVGSVSSPALQAIIAVVDNRFRKVGEQWPEMPKDPAELHAALMAAERLRSDEGCPVERSPSDVLIEYCGCAVYRAPQKRRGSSRREIREQVAPARH